MKFVQILALIRSIQTLVAILQDGTIDEAEKSQCADELLSLTETLLNLSKGVKK
ncbi:hypothetical protein [Microviridae sp.]|nr:hypothetical protein [Microviridae sp.]